LGADWLGRGKSVGLLMSSPNGALMMLFATCGSTHRESDLDIIMIAIVSPLLAMAAVICPGLGIRVVVKRPDAKFGHPWPKPLAKDFSTGFSRSVGSS
jgi:hypothetical protein